MGFVSNSSSSSFIVGVSQKDVSPKFTYSPRMEVDLDKFIHVVISDEEKLRTEFKNQQGEGWEKDQDVLDLFEKCMEVIEGGGSIWFGEFQSYGDEVESLLADNGLIDEHIEEPNFTVLYNERS